MKYVTLLRGINVGGKNRVEMKRLRSLLESRGFTAVATYLNSGNLIFDSEKERGSLVPEIHDLIREEFGLRIPLLIKTAEEMRAVADAFPPTWKNDSDQRSDAAYLFPEIDSPEIASELPVNRECMDIRYVKGALIWNMDRKDNNRSRLSKLAGHRLYQFMTVRNVNTARYLGNL